MLLSATQPSIVVSGVTNDSTSKPVSVSITVNGSDTGDITIGSDGTFSKTVTLEKDGTYTVLITATDIAGNSTGISRTMVSRKRTCGRIRCG